MTEVLLDLQIVYDAQEVPTEAAFTRWINGTLSHLDYHKAQAEVTLRVVENADIQSLNRDYRGIDKPTNALSFPFDDRDLPPELLAETFFLGDIIIAPDVLRTEAREQGKSLIHHWAHMTVHGMLHLLGYDHETDADARVMETLEVNILTEFGVTNPYEDDVID